MSFIINGKVVKELSVAERTISSVGVNGNILFEKTPTEEREWKLDESSYIIGNDGKYYQRLYDDSEVINVTIDLNNQWKEDSVSGNLNIDPNYTYYMSNSNYHSSSSFSQFKVSWSGKTQVNFLYRSYAESSFDYLVINGLDKPKFSSAPSSTTSGILAHTKGNQTTTYNTLTVNCDKGEHYLWFCYIKDSSANEKSDRAFVGVPKSGELYEKQGELLPSEYALTHYLGFDGVNYRYKKYRQYTLPNGEKTNFVLDDYILDDNIQVIGDAENVGDAMYIEALENDTTFSFIEQNSSYNYKGKVIQYNLNGGAWAPYNRGDEISMFAGDKLYLKSDDEIVLSFLIVRVMINVNRSYNVGGNAMSLLNYSDTVPSDCFQYLFYKQTNLKQVSDKLLPATTLASGCYQFMFYGCTSLVNAPELPATTLASDCYRSMFSNCTSLKEIYCMARYSSETTEITSSIGDGWLSSVTNTSDCIFHKNPGWPGPTSRGNDTIPSNWTIVDWIQVPGIDYGSDGDGGDGM